MLVAPAMVGALAPAFPYIYVNGAVFRIFKNGRRVFARAGGRGGVLELGGGAGLMLLA